MAWIVVVDVTETTVVCADARERRKMRQVVARRCTAREQGIVDGGLEAQLDGARVQCEDAERTNQVYLQPTLLYLSRRARVGTRWYSCLACEMPCSAAARRRHCG